MGLYEEAGKLNYIGRCGVGDNGQEITKFLKPFIGGSGVTGSTQAVLAAGPVESASPFHWSLA